MDTNNKTCCSASRASSDQPSVHPEVLVSVEIPMAAGPIGKEGMVLIPGGKFLMGTDDREGFPADGEGPVREINLKPFYIDTCAVTNADFKQFVDATNYKTEAESFGWSFVFHLFVSEATAARVQNKVQQTPWWWVVEGQIGCIPRGPIPMSKIAGITRLSMFHGAMRWPIANGQANVYQQKPNGNMLLEVG